MIKLASALLLLGLLFGASMVNATEYSIQPPYAGATGQWFLTQSSACTDYGPRFVSAAHPDDDYCYANPRTNNINICRVRFIDPDSPLQACNDNDSQWSDFSISNRPDSCISPQVWDPPTQQCVDATTCTAVLSDASNPYHTRLLTESSASAITHTICMDVPGAGKCEYTDQGGVGVILTQVSKSFGNYKINGNTCDPAKSGIIEYQNYEPVDAGGGNTVSMHESKPNCGTFNGEQICIANLPDSTCLITPGGSYVCSVNLGTPPQPNNGTSGVTATPDLVIADSETGTVDGTGAFNYYSSGTVAGSTEQSGVEEGTQTCGGAGQQPCKYEIDETGTPSISDGAYNSKLDGITDALNIGQETVPSGQQTISDALTNSLPQYGSCQTIDFSFLGFSAVFPSASQCQKLEQVKVVLGWLIWIYTAAGIVEIVTKRV